MNMLNLGEQFMKRLFTIFIIIVISISLFIGLLFVFKYFDKDSNLNIETEETINQEINNEPKLTCFELIDKQLTADGFTYLEEAKWGRGINNNFIVDLVAQEFQMSDSRNAERIPADWYKDNTWYYWGYYHLDKKLWSSFNLMNGGQKDSDSLIIDYNNITVDNLFYEFPDWMDYYINQANKYGCSIEGLTAEKLTGEFKTLKSTATQSDVISVFDRKSEDGVIRYFNDVHVEGNIEDNPRYKEVMTKEEYYALAYQLNQEQFNVINVLYRDWSNRVYYPDGNNIQASIIKEFTKDVVFPYTTWVGDNPTNDTIGVYFIYVDNPNGEFEFIYKTPEHNGRTYVESIEKFETLKTPKEGIMFMVNKQQDKDGPIWSMSSTLMNTLIAYMRDYIKYVNPDFNYAEDFVTYYTRPFNPDWQRVMGLTEFFDKKYGYVNHEVKYEAFVQ